MKDKIIQINTYKGFGPELYGLGESGRVYKYDFEHGKWEILTENPEIVIETKVK
jgi:hypothetical protein